MRPSNITSVAIRDALKMNVFYFNGGQVKKKSSDNASTAFENFTLEFH